jgi:hypothetical protein
LPEKDWSNGQIGEIHRINRMDRIIKKKNNRDTEDEEDKFFHLLLFSSDPVYPINPVALLFFVAGLLAGGAGKHSLTMPFQGCLENS